MIEQLKISNLAIIEDTTIDFSSSYSVLLGETGSGKSLIVNSLLLISGEKANYSLIKDKTKKATISATFSINNEFVLINNDIKEYLDDNLINFKRVLSSDKTSKYYINDELVPQSVYKKITNHLIDIHSQGTNWDLFDENKHLIYLDQFGQNEIKNIKDDFLNIYNKYLEKKNELKNLIIENEKFDLDYLEYQINEIEKYHLKENEIEDLNNEYNSLKSYEKLNEGYKNYQNIKYLNEGKLEDILINLSNKLNPFKESSLEKQVDIVKNNISSLIEELKEFDYQFNNLNIDPNKIDQINERLFELKSLQRKYGNTTKDILNKLEEYKNQIDNANIFASKKDKLEKEIKSLYDESMKKALNLSKIRKEYALKLEKNIVSTMKDLNFANNDFKIDFSEVELSNNGIDDVKFKVCLNKGSDYLNLAKACSGGEASRIMLSLKIVLNSLQPYNVVVLDEIDIGVSGYTATLIGKKIKEISSSSQLIVISHLPQVIVYGNSFLKVFKESDKSNTISKVKKIDEKELTLDIARMLSLNKVNDEALIQAQKLIEEARQ